MAYIFGCGFEDGTYTAFESSVLGLAHINIVATPYVDGVYSAQMQENFGSPALIHEISPTLTEIWIGFWIQAGYQGNGGAGFNLGVLLTDGKFVGVRLNGWRYDAYVDTTLVASGAVQTDANWANLQIHIKIDDAVGAIDTRINGLDDVAYAGDTKPTTATDILKIYLSYGAANEASGLIDHAVANDATWPDDIRIIALKPVSDDSVQWNRSTGANNYATVDEVPPNDTDYNYTDVNAQRDLFNVEDFDTTNRSPKFVMQTLRARKDTANAQQIKMVLKSGATTDVGPAIDLGPSYTTFHRLLDQDPDGDIPWTDSAIDALQAGYDSVV